MIEIAVLVFFALLAHLLFRPDVVKAMSIRPIPPLTEEATGRAFAARWITYFILGSEWLGYHLVKPWNILSIVGYGHVLLIAGLTAWRRQSSTKADVPPKTGKRPNDDLSR